MKEVNQVLQNKRFNISLESQAIIDNVKKSFAEGQTRHPALGGLGFFGSRIKGLSNKDSDLDLIIFYNNDRLNMSEEAPDAIHPRERMSALFNGNVDSVMVDISSEATERDLKSFFNFSRPHVEWNIPLDMDEPIAQILELTERFFLAVGNEVYANRSFILNRFKEMSKGDMYFKFLMQHLAIVERPDEARRPNKKTATKYERYPQTVSEAENYFLTRF